MSIISVSDLKDSADAPEVTEDRVVLSVLQIGPFSLEVTVMKTLKL